MVGYSGLQRYVEDADIPFAEETIDVIAGRIGAIQSLITRIGMLSIPVTLLDGIDAIEPFISLLSVQLKEKCSHMGRCLGVKRCS